MHKVQMPAWLLQWNLQESPRATCRQESPSVWLRAQPFSWSLSPIPHQVLEGSISWHFLPQGDSSLGISQGFPSQ